MNIEFILRGTHKGLNLDPFEKETGIKVVQVFNPVVGKVKAMVTTGNVEWDVVEYGGAMMLRSVKENMLEKLDYSYFNEETLSGYEDFQKEPYGIWFMMYSVVIAYSKDAYPVEHPTSWADVWNVKKFPGPRCLKSGAGSGYAPIEEALLADGVPIDKLYPCDIDRAFKSLNRIRDHVIKWWTSGAQAPQLLIDKEATVVEAYNGRIARIIDQGARVAIEWNQGRLTHEVLVIPRGTKNYDLAMKLITFMSRADRQAAMSKGYPNGAVNKHAYSYISPERAKVLASSPENRKKQFLFNRDYKGS
ncbi:MAG: ABC transporter substrate-binding protein [Deltaproteobacteria bacterium]|nr:ABC transporter substrate-binding protein [Deltaproteobacteria bacterium]